MYQLFLPFLLFSCFATSTANRVYVHPFNLFSFELNCEVIQTDESQPLDTVSPTPLQESTDPDPKINTDSERPQNITQRTAVLAGLQNSLGLRMYQTLGPKQTDANTMFSPINAFGALVTLYLGASKKTAISFQELIGLNWESDKPDCVYLMDGHTVLSTLQSINALIDGPRDELRTLVWAFVSSDANLLKDFVLGTQDFSDASYIRAVDFSKTKDAETEVNSFIQKTSDGKIKDLFKDVSEKTNFLFSSSVHFKGNWRTAFQPEETSTHEFKVDKTSTVKVPLMTHTADYMYLDDKRRKCSVVQLGLSKQSYMLLMLPDEDASLQDTESHFLTEVIPNWHQHLKETYLELSLPKFSLTSVTDLRAILSDMKVEKHLLGSDANFQKLSSKENFTVDKVFSEVVFEMSEEGSAVRNETEEGKIPLRVTVDRPFHFAIVEGNTHAILVLGKITNPAL